VRLEAAKKARHQGRLARMAAFDTSPEVRHASASRIRHRRHLQFVVEHGLYDEERVATLARLDPATTGELLAVLASSDASPPLRRAALDLIVDVAGIHHVLRTSPHPDQRLAALAKLPLKTDPQVFANICNRDTDIGVCLAAVERLQDSALLAKLATSHRVGKVRGAALSKTKEMSALIRACRSDSLEENRLLAVGQITDQGTLLHCALNDPTMCVAIGAVKRLTEPYHLFQVAAASTNPEIYKSAIRRIVAHANRVLEIRTESLRDLGEFSTRRLNTTVIAACYSITARQCVLLRRMVAEFFDRYSFQLGPKLALMQSTHFLTTLIDKGFIPSPDEVRNLLYYLAPPEPKFNPDAMAFDRQLSLRPQTIQRHAAIVAEIENLITTAQSRKGHVIRRLGQGVQFRPETIDLELLEPLMTKSAELQTLAGQLDAISARIESAKSSIATWVSTYRAELLELKDQQEAISARIPDLPPVWHSDDVTFYQGIRRNLDQPHFLYERSALADLLTTVFRDSAISTVARAVLVSDQARFLREAFKEHIQMLPDAGTQYKVDGPSCIQLSNSIHDVSVGFLIVGPTIDQLELGLPGSDSDTATVTILPGPYTIACLPKGKQLNPLIVEGTCQPGRAYPIGVALKQSGDDDGSAHELGNGQTTNTAIFGVAEVDPGESLSMTFDGREYTIGKYLGAGSAGFVYVGTDAVTSESFAFKFMTAIGFGARAQIELGRLEWEFYNRLQSREGVITMHAFSEAISFLQRGSPISNKRLVAAHKMEYAELGSLDEYVATRQAAPDPQFVMSIMCDLCAGLHSLHEAGFIHRDIRPSNILVVSDKPQCRICDFTLLSDRIGRVKDELSAMFATAQVAYSQDLLHGIVAGSTLQSYQRLLRSSTSYAAPEEHDGIGSPDHRADIYAAGGVLYWLLVGFDPFELLLRERNRSLYERYKAATDRKVLHLDRERCKKIFGEFADLNSQMRIESLSLKKTGLLELHYDELAVPGLDQRSFTALQRVVSRSIHPDPGSRYSSIREMADDLQGAFSWVQNANSKAEVLESLSS
jgi:serine/threonine protein kinase